MKKCFVIVAMVLMASGLLAQESPFYLVGYGGIGMNLSADGFRLLSNSTSLYDMEADTTTYNDSFELVDRSFGKAKRFGLALGIRLSKEYPGLKFQIGLVKQANSTFEYEAEKRDVVQSYMNFFVNRNDEILMKASAMFINPALIMQMQSGNWRPYMKMGLLVVFASLEQENQILYSTNLPNYYPTSSGTLRYEYEIGAALGADFALGTTYPMGSGFSVMAEVDFQYVRVAPTKATITEYTERGTDYLSSLTTAEKEIEFVDSYSDNYSPSPNQPSKALKEYATFNALSVQAGIVYQF